MTEKVEPLPLIVNEYLDSPLVVAEYLAAAIDDEPDASAGELRVFIAEAIVALRRLHDERNEDDALREKLGGLLTGTANALKGEPNPLMHHSWHDLPEWAADARAVAMGYLAATAPGASHIERENFVLALSAWRTRFGRDIAETAEALTMLDKDAKP